MNVVIIVIMLALTASLGFVAGHLMCLSKIENLKLENGILNEWLSTSRKTCERLAEECDELSKDLESVVNGGHIVSTFEDNNTNVE